MHDERVRRSHKQWDDVCLPVGDDWWDTHYPPNGWRCRCSAFAISQREYDKRAAAQADLVRENLVGLNPRVGAALWANLDAPALVLQRQTLAELVTTTAETMTPVGSAALVYAVTEATQAAPAALPEHAVLLESAAVILTDQALAHALRDTNPEGSLPAAFWAGLTAWLARATPYLDTEDPALVYAAPAAEGHAAKVVLRINYRDKARLAGKRDRPRANFVRTGGVVERADIEGKPRYLALPK